MYCLSCPGCAADDVAFDPAGTAAAAAAVFQGVSPLPDRSTVLDSVAPLEAGPESPMAAASQVAVRELETMLTARPGDSADALLDAAEQAGIAALRRAVDATGRRSLSDEEAARLSVLLILDAVQEAAWTGCDGTDAQLWLWGQLTRRTVPPLAAAPARLLAATAYLRGDGVLARAAAERALETDPGDRRAQTLVAAVDVGLSPDEWRTRSR
ncbi:DUF4192 family protein [Actinoplanes sp. NPDC051633]|uniref:DUF4192 family protein n=1 Tax=Actinoplanes sp. NPDC051633 TaxID=3155670 RepID=UPI0034425BF3